MKTGEIRERDIKDIFGQEIKQVLEKYVVKAENVRIQRAEIDIGVCGQPTIKLEIILFNK